MKRLALACGACLLAIQAALGQELKLLGEVELRGDLDDDSKAVSAVGVVGDFLVIGADEGRNLYVFQRHPGVEDRNRYDLAHPIKLPSQGKEIDIEGIACDGRGVYVVGSHARTRPKLEAGAPLNENRKRIAEIKHHGSREQLFHFKLDESGHPGPIRVTSLRDVIEKSDVLAPFTRLPAKENGVDIEGIAVRDDLLFVGFRGPVLTGNFVPVLTCKFAEPIKTADVVFVELGGRGIRDLTSVKGGLLILAGPVGQGPGSFQLYFWDGFDCLPGKRDSGRAGGCRLLCEVPAPGRGRPEGVAVLKETASDHELLIVHDGLKNGGARRYQLAKGR